jgi:RHS repeat-associated protein
MRTDLLKRLLLLPVFALLAITNLHAQFEGGVRDIQQLGIITGTQTQTFPVSNTVTIAATQGESAKKIQNIIRFKLNELAVNGSNQLLFFKSGFTANVTLNVDVWTNLAVNNTPTPDATLTPTVQLVVNFDPATGSTYNPVAYWVLPAGYEKVKVNVINVINVTGFSNGWTAANILPLLTVENEMNVLRYFTTPALLPSAITQVYDGASHADQLSVSWTMPVGANTSQLEYAWVENESKNYYNVAGVFNTDKLFQLASTRVDIDTSGKIFNIPLLYDADPALGGTLYYRMRNALRKNDGSVITGGWSTPQTFTNPGHEPNMNWQSSTSFAENGKSKTVIQYFDGSLRPRQTVTKDNSTGNTTVAETIYDLQGRAMVQILPTPTLLTSIAYAKNFNLFAGQQLDEDPAKYFDLALAGAQCTPVPRLDISRGNGMYYSSNNPFPTTESLRKYIPDADGYAYTETRYTDDPTQRVISQGGVGKAHQIGSGHETKYYYGKPNQNELDALFGTEVGDASHYSKNMVQDANGQLSVSYVDMHGRTVATALAGDTLAGVNTINNNTAFYPKSSGQLTGNIITPSTNIIKSDSIEAISTILVSSNTAYNFTYQLTPAILQQLNCNSQQICFDCKYDLEITLRNEDCSAVPIVRRYSNLQLVPASQACGTPMGFIGDNGTTPQTQITFSVPLTIGSWIVRKTLSINDSMFRVRRDSALTAFLCKTQQQINDSVFTALSTIAGCNTPAVTRNCTACQAMLTGGYTGYKNNFLTAVGGTTTLTDTDIHAQYTADSLACTVACGTSYNPVFNTLAGIRTQMLNDMIPYTGQYAIPFSEIGSLSFLQSKYNIFTPSYTDVNGFGQFAGVVKPFYLNPVSEPAGASTFYSPGDGTVDNTIYPSGTAGQLSGISVDSFTNLFNRSWANQLIYFHPEYSRLKYAETALLSSYTWLDKVQQCATYAQALANGYLTPLTSDPYFVNNYVAADNGAMNRYLTQYIGKYDPANASGALRLSIWRIANAQALCDTSLPLLQRKLCMNAMNATGIDAAAVTTQQKDAVWEAFRSTYLSSRNEFVINYINTQQAASLSKKAMDTLVREGKQLWFANAQTTADQNGLTWWATATDTLHFVDSVAMTNLGKAFVDSNGIDPCEGQRPFWKMRLLQCEVLRQYLINQTAGDSLKVETITKAILDSMVMVCKNSVNTNNPSGASNVNPALMPKVPANFEYIINRVLARNFIDTLANTAYFCNPYTIDYPKAFNANPPVFVNEKATLDSCNCKQFGIIKTTAKAAGFDTLSLSSMNSYLWANYSDSISQTLWQGLLLCNSNSWYLDTCFVRTGGGGAVAKTTMALALITADSCVHLYATAVKLTAAVIVPPFLNCGYIKPCITCATLQKYTDTFRIKYPGFSGVPYTYNVDTGSAKKNALWARYLNYKTGFSYPANVYITAYLNCGLSAGSADLVLTDRIAQPPTGSAAPYIYTASNSITFSPGFESLPGDNFETLIAATLSGTGTALCSFTKPVTFLPLPDTTRSNPCQAVQYEAYFIGQLVYQQRKDSLIANFDSLYRVKCLGAQSQEVFYYTYTPAEFHYTLYYYDQAGNLLKTLPPAAVKPNFDTTYLRSVQTARTARTDLYNTANIENMGTNYRYNTLNQVIAQKTPDAGKSSFWYDRLGRLVVSQNAKQAIAPVAYSYTLYDYLGRITEVGQKPQVTAMTQATSQDTTGLKNWLADLVNGGVKQQITRTVYDVAYPGFTGTSPITQLNLRNRVAYTQVIDADNTNVPPYRAASFYSYDIHGNVDSLVQDYGPASIMGTATGNRFKLMTYDYDLISGKVNQVSYQPGKADGFYHQYSYDAENRITAVRTSRDSVFWQNDADYQYYRHGPLGRTQLGDLRVQGIDYAYTLQGWLKSVNPSNVNVGGDLLDSDGTVTPALFARDAYKFNLNYYDNGTYTDYTPIAPPAGYVQGNGLPTAAKNNLFNGNIGSMAVSIRQLAAQSSSAFAGPLIYNYKYDQLNRIASMDAWQAYGNFAPTGTTPVSDYAERYGYDPNGNILNLSRNATTGNSGQLAMDNMTYSYKAGTNQLDKVVDIAPDFAGYSDIKQGQANGNYQYDAIGNLVGDAQAGITNITWSVYGKILSITKAAGTLTYTYDANGNRISKNYLGITTWYVRDASGNVMSVYVQGDNTKNSGTLTQTELHVYGSSRLGVLNTNLNCLNLGLKPLQTVFTRGSKIFELSNHLGNVLITVSDKKIGVDANSDGVIDYYNVDVVTANDYFPGGMLMPGRKYSKPNSNYRYGFNGKEKDNETRGEGNSYDYGARMYDPRLSRWLSTDPLQQKYADLSPYNYCANSPISAKDPDGRVIIFINGLWTPGTPVGQPLEPYWSSHDGINNWITQAQDRIGDHAQPRYYDGSLGGTASLFKDNPNHNPMFASTRIAEGRKAGYKDAAAILGNLSDGETIKIVTNSMGTAFARGFTKGILEYQAEENGRRTTFNNQIDKMLAPLSKQKEFLDEMSKFTNNMKNDVKDKLAKDVGDINSKIDQLKATKKQLLNVQFESETDLSSHQVDYTNPDVQNSYYMTTNKLALIEKIFVNQKSINGATNLGTMDIHHSSGATPANLPASTTADPNPPPKKK